MNFCVMNWWDILTYGIGITVQVVIACGVFFWITYTLVRGTMAIREEPWK